MIEFGHGFDQNHVWYCENEVLFSSCYIKSDTFLSVLLVKLAFFSISFLLEYFQSRTVICVCFLGL